MVKSHTSELDIKGPIIESALEVHKALGGPGLTTEIYCEALTWELSSRGYDVENELAVPVSYKGIQLGALLRPNLLVNKNVLVNVKASSVLDPLCQKETLTCLRLLNLSHGLVINFGVTSIQDGISTLSA